MSYNMNNNFFNYYGIGSRFDAIKRVSINTYGGRIIFVARRGSLSKEKMIDFIIDHLKDSTEKFDDYKVCALNGYEFVVGVYTGHRRCYYTSSGMSLLKGMLEGIKIFERTQVVYTYYEGVFMSEVEEKNFLHQLVQINPNGIKALGLTSLFALSYDRALKQSFSCLPSAKEIFEIYDKLWRRWGIPSREGSESAIKW